MELCQFLLPRNWLILYRGSHSPILWGRYWIVICRHTFLRREGQSVQLLLFLHSILPCQKLGRLWSWCTFHGRWKNLCLNALISLKTTHFFFPLACLQTCYKLCYFQFAWCFWCWKEEWKFESWKIFISQINHLDFLAEELLPVETNAPN